MTHSLPPHAIPCWCDDTHIFVALPTKDAANPHYVMSFSLTEGGLSKALGLLRQHTKAPLPSFGKAKAPTVVRSTVVATVGQRTDARAALRKVGLI